METACAEHGRMMATISDLVTEIRGIATTQALSAKDIEYLRRDQETILARFGKHVEDAEKEGGRHERLQKAEDAIKALQSARRLDMLGAGLIGGLIGSGSAGALNAFLGFWK